MILFICLLNCATHATVSSIRRIVRAASEECGMGRVLVHLEHVSHCINHKAAKSNRIKSDRNEVASQLGENECTGRKV